MRRITTKASVAALALTGAMLTGGTAVAHAASAPPAPTSSTTSSSTRSGAQDPLTVGDSIDNPADPQGGQHEAANEPDDATEASTSSSGQAGAPDTGTSAAGADAEANDGGPTPATPGASGTSPTG